MRIAICIDEAFETERLYSLIEKYALKKDYNIHCGKFTSGNDLLKQECYYPAAERR